MQIKLDHKIKLHDKNTIINGIECHLYTRFHVLQTIIFIYYIYF